MRCRKSILLWILIFPMLLHLVSVVCALLMPWDNVSNIYEKLWLRKYWFRLSGDDFWEKKGRINVFVWQSLENNKMFVHTCKFYWWKFRIWKFNQVRFRSSIFWQLETFDISAIILASFKTTWTDSLWLLLFRLLPGRTIQKKFWKLVLSLGRRLCINS